MAIDLRWRETGIIDLCRLVKIIRKPVDLHPVLIHRQPAIFTVPDLHSNILLIEMQR